MAALLQRVENSQMGVILKRMMLRVGERLAQELEIDALVTGECVAQVSSQTLRNGLSSIGGLAPIPVPPAVWLFGSGLLGLVAVARRRL